jgi:hypothetical protein
MTSSLLSRSMAVVCALALTGTSVVGQSQKPAGTVVPVPIGRFVRPTNPIALMGSVRPERYMEASGRQAAFLGREDGSFEAWVYPLKVLHDFQLSFGTAAYAAPIPGASLASTVDVRPETSSVRYSHAAFTVDATWFVPLTENGGVVLLDISTSEPLTIVVQFRTDLKPMWPAALGGQYSSWDDTLKAYVVGEASGKHWALIGSPFASQPPEQPAHNLPDAPSQFSMTISPEAAADGLVPIVIAASPEGLEGAKAAYQRLLTTTAGQYRETFEHYQDLRDKLTSIDTPDDRLDLALEWGKVALDKGFVCNPQLGCGLIAGLGPSGTSERPGFGWFFGGDAFINAWAMTGYGDFETVRKSLEFLRARQRADGKMMHELSQGAAYVKWFEEFPYGYYHADTTPLYIIAVRDYVRASGDTAFAKAFWPSIKLAYGYCLSTDEDGDGLMDNSKAGLAAVETGALRRKDVLTDVYLAAAWTEAADATAELSTAAGDLFANTARLAAEKARTSLHQRFLDDDHNRIFFAVMKDGQGLTQQTAWPAFGLWRGVFNPGRPAVQGTLDDLAGPGLGADWGARMLSIESSLYEPLSYNNGASWPFLSGFAALALYTNGRPEAAWAYLDGMADLTFLESRGYMAELFSGDRLRSVDAAVPHQLFATTGFVSTLLRGLAGISVAPGEVRGKISLPERLVIAPQLPADWGWLRIRNLRWHGIVADVAITRDEETLGVSVTPHGGTLPIETRLTFAPGSTVRQQKPEWQLAPASAGALVNPYIWRFDQLVRPASFSLEVSPGLEFTPVQSPQALGDVSSRLRIIETTLAGNKYEIRVAGRRSRTYRVRMMVPFLIKRLTGARYANSPDGKPAASPLQMIEITIPPAPPGSTGLRRSLEWGTQTVTLIVDR